MTVAPRKRGECVYLGKGSWVGSYYAFSVAPSFGERAQSDILDSSQRDHSTVKVASMHEEA